MERRRARVHAWIAFLLFVGLTSGSGADKIVVGYYPDGNKSAYPYTSVPYQCLTHIAHAFLIPNADGSLGGTSGFTYPELVQEAHAHGVKVIVSIGGWGQSAGFSPMSADTGARRRFIQNILSFCVTHGYDGADLDWEYPASSVDRTNLDSLVHQLREAFNTVNTPLSLSIAAPSSDWSGRWFNVIGLMADLSWIGIMTYDYYGSWTSISGPNAALYGNFSVNPEGWVDHSVNYYMGRGVSKQKLLIGIPFYGWVFSAADMYAASSGASQEPYSSIVPRLQQGWLAYWDGLGRVPYMINQAHTRTISYDDTTSVREKCQYVTSKDVGGAIIWAVGQDLVSGIQPLLATVGIHLRPQTAVPLSDDVRSLPERPSLSQNFPNPFNPQTTIRYDIPAPGFISLTLYDLLGREVRTLVDGMQRQGDYEVTITSDDLASGMYVYRLTWNGYTTSRRCVVIR